MSSKSRRPALAAAALVIGGWLFASACGLFRDDRPNILLITIDTLRADHLSAYGFQDRKTPSIDMLAKQGALFEAAYCDVTWTTPSMVSTFTGKFAVRHGFKSFYDVVSGDQMLFTELLREDGYRTAAVIASYPLDSIYGLDRGFEIYDDNFTAPLLYEPGVSIRHIESKRGRSIEEHHELLALKARNDSYRPDNEVTNAAAKVLELFREEKKPFFLWVHYFGPHGITVLGESLMRHWRLHIEDYPNKVVRADREINRLLMYLYALKSERKTFVILHSDHGESLFEHEFVGHGRYLYENTLRVPLIMRWPGVIEPGTRFDALVGNIDIAPTILEAAGIDPDDFDMDGRSLFDVIRTGKPIHDEMYAETYMAAQKAFATILKDKEGNQVRVGARRRGVLRPPWKYVWNEAYPIYGEEDAETPDYLKAQVDGRELYNLDKDPGELENLATEDSESIAELSKSLTAYIALEAGSVEAGDRELSTEEEDKLRSLGYVE